MCRTNSATCAPKHLTRLTDLDILRPHVPLKVTDNKKENTRMKHIKSASAPVCLPSKADEDTLSSLLESVKTAPKK